MNRALILTALLLAACGGTSVPAPQPSLLPPTGSIGDPCAIDADCASGLCDRTVPGGYCTRPCDSDDQCGALGICDGGACLQRCTVQRECRSAEFECWDLGRPDGLGACAFDVANLAPNAPNIGAPCRAAIECLGPAELESYCIPEIGYRGEETGHPGGFCTALGCLDDSSCGPGSRCIGDDALHYCAPACSASTECREGYACSDALGACLPAE